MLPSLHRLAIPVATLTEAQVRQAELAQECASRAEEEAGRATQAARNVRIIVQSAVGPSVEAARAAQEATRHGFDALNHELSITDASDSKRRLHTEALEDAIAAMGHVNTALNAIRLVHSTIEQLLGMQGMNAKIEEGDEGLYAKIFRDATDTTRVAMDALNGAYAKLAEEGVHRLNAASRSLAATREALSAAMEALDAVVDNLHYEYRE